MRWTIKKIDMEKGGDPGPILHEFDGDGPIHISQTFLQMWDAPGVLIEADPQTPIEVQEADG